MTATITLDAATFWELRARCEKTARCLVQLQAVREALVAAEREQLACLAPLAAEHHFDPHIPTFTLDDEARTLTVDVNAPARSAA